MRDWARCEADVVRLMNKHFTKGRGGATGAADIRAGLALTGYFLESRVLSPRGETLPDVRSRLNDLLAR